MIYGGYCTGGIGYLIEMKEHTYQDLTLEFMSTLHIELTRGPNVKWDTLHFISKGNFMS